MRPPPLYPFVHRGTPAPHTAYCAMDVEGSTALPWRPSNAFDTRAQKDVHIVKPYTNAHFKRTPSPDHPSCFIGMPRTPWVKHVQRACAHAAADYSERYETWSGAGASWMHAMQRTCGVLLDALGIPSCVREHMARHGAVRLRQSRRPGVLLLQVPSWRSGSGATAVAQHMATALTCAARLHHKMHLPEVCLREVQSADAYARANGIAGVYSAHSGACSTPAASGTARNEYKSMPPAAAAGVALLHPAPPTAAVDWATTCSGGAALHGMLGLRAAVHSVQAPRGVRKQVVPMPPTALMKLAQGACCREVSDGGAAARPAQRSAVPYAAAASTHPADAPLHYVEWCTVQAFVSPWGEALSADGCLQGGMSVTHHEWLALCAGMPALGDVKAGMCIVGECGVQPVHGAPAPTSTTAWCCTVAAQPTAGMGSADGVDCADDVAHNAQWRALRGALTARCAAVQLEPAAQWWAALCAAACNVHEAWQDFLHEAHAALHSAGALPQWAPQDWQRACAAVLHEGHCVHDVLGVHPAVLLPSALRAGWPLQSLACSTVGAAQLPPPCALPPSMQVAQAVALASSTPTWCALLRTVSEHASRGQPAAGCGRNGVDTRLHMPIAPLVKGRKRSREPVPAQPQGNQDAVRTQQDSPQEALPPSAAHAQHVLRVRDALGMAALSRALMPHQVRAVHAVLASPVACHTGGWLALDMGMGKTATVWAAIATDAALQAKQREEPAYRCSSTALLTMATAPLHAQRLLHAVRRGALQAAVAQHVAQAPTSASSVGGTRDAAGVHDTVRPLLCAALSSACTRVGVSRNSQVFQDTLRWALDAAVVPLHAWTAVTPASTALLVARVATLQAQEVLREHPAAVEAACAAWAAAQGGTATACVARSILQHAAAVVHRTVRSLDCMPADSNWAADVSVVRSPQANARVPEQQQQAVTAKAENAASTLQEQAIQACMMCRPTLVFAPPGLLQVWQAEADDTLQAGAATVAVVRSASDLKGAVSALLRVCAHAGATGGGAAGTMCTLLVADSVLEGAGEGAEGGTAGCCGVTDTLGSLPWSRVFIDEAHSLSNAASVRHGTLLRVLQASRRVAQRHSPCARVPVWLLTGTPIRNDAADVHAQGALLDTQGTALLAAPAAWPPEQWCRAATALPPTHHCARTGDKGTRQQAGTLSCNDVALFLLCTMVCGAKAALERELPPKRRAWVPIALEPACAAQHAAAVCGSSKRSSAPQHATSPRMDNRLNRLEACAHGSDTVLRSHSTCTAQVASRSGGGLSALSATLPMGGKVSAAVQVAMAAAAQGRSTVVFVRRLRTCTAVLQELQRAIGVAAATAAPRSVGSAHVAGAACMACTAAEGHACSTSARGAHLPPAPAAALDAGYAHQVHTAACPTLCAEAPVLQPRTAVVQWVQGAGVQGTPEVCTDCLARQAAVSVAAITGGTSHRVREAAVGALNRATAASPMVLVATLRTCGTGLRMVGASHVVFVEHDYCPATHQQAEDRVHRPGQRARAVDVTYLVGVLPRHALQVHCRPSVDAALCALRSHKATVAEELLLAASASHSVPPGSTAACAADAKTTVQLLGLVPATATAGVKCAGMLPALRAWARPACRALSRCMQRYTAHGDCAVLGPLQAMHTREHAAAQAASSPSLCSAREVADCVWGVGSELHCAAQWH